MEHLAIARMILFLVSTGLTGSCQSSPDTNASYLGESRNGTFITQNTNGLSAFTIPDPAPAQQPGIKRTELQRHDLSVPGREVIQSRIDFDPGAAFGKHSHPGEEIIYVLEGLLEYQVEGKPPVTLKAGDVSYIPAGTIHAARNVGRVNGAELATYVVEKGKPLVVMVK